MSIYSLIEAKHSHNSAYKYNSIWPTIFTLNLYTECKIYSLRKMVTCRIGIEIILNSDIESKN